MEAKSNKNKSVLGHFFSWVHRIYKDICLFLIPEGNDLQTLEGNRRQTLVLKVEGSELFGFRSTKLRFILFIRHKDSYKCLFSSINVLFIELSEGGGF